jgi:hypothetical protein
MFINYIGTVIQRCYSSWVNKIVGIYATKINNFVIINYKEQNNWSSIRSWDQPKNRSVIRMLRMRMIIPRLIAFKFKNIN